MTKQPISHAGLKSDQTLPEQRRRSRQRMFLHKICMEATVNLVELDPMLQTFLSIIQKSKMLHSGKLWPYPRTLD